jgi:K+-transporting ATPase KdpF subunit
MREALSMETTVVTLISAALLVYLFWSLLRPESF